MRSLWLWFMRWWDAEDRTQDIKLLGFILVVVAGIVFLGVDLRRGITKEWVDAFSWLCILVGGGGAFWTAVEKWKGGKGGASQPAKAPGAPGEGGQP